MKRGRLVAILFAVVVLGAMGSCAPKPSAAPTTFTPVASGPTDTQSRPTSTALVVVTPLPSATIVRSATLLPTLTSTAEPTWPPSPTPYPTLPAVGPYLAYTKEKGNQLMLVITGADGIGRKEYELLNDDFLYDLSRRISPNDEWMAYYSGTVDRSDSMSVPNDLTLNLLKLSDGQTQTVAALLSPDYPQNFEVNAAALSRIDPQRFPANAQLAEELRFAFSNGIHSMAWSPDSLHLAFAGEMDGPSSDLYTYNLDSHSIQRLTDGLGEIQEISWSPDGKWILNMSAYWVGEGAPGDSYVAAADGSGVKPVGGGQYMGGWLSSSEMLRYSGANGIGDFELQKVNLETGQVFNLMPGPFWTFAVDKMHHLLAVNSTGGMQVQGGLYLIDLSDNTSKYLGQQVLRPIEVLSDPVYLFVGTESTVGGARTLLITADGTTTQVSDAYTSLAVSPSGYAIALYRPGLAFYTSNGQLVRSVAIQAPEQSRALWSPDSKGLVVSTDPGLIYVSMAGGEPVTITTRLTAAAITWRPDSAGLFFTSGTDLYYWALGQPLPAPVDQNVPGNYHFHSVWLDRLGPALSP